MPALAVAERARICDTALASEPDAPTLCEGWSVTDLLAHLVVREGNPLGAPGILVPQLEFLTDAAMQRAARRGLPALVEQFRRPPFWSPFRLPALDVNLNALEFFVHHEDIRRAVPGWEPRDLAGAEQGALWKAIGTAGKAMVRSAKVPVTIVREGTDETRVLAEGDDPVVVTGPPAEVVLFLFGRKEHRGVAFTGPADKVATLQGKDLGF